MEIKIGEYVRTKDGIIDKIFKFDEMLNEYWCEKGLVIDPENKIETHLKDIVKHSFNIIDLIEVGDFVNENEVIDKYLFNGEMPVLETTGDETNAKCMCESDIRTILTHEQYERNCYKIN
jgi:hypothetical protein